MDLDLHIHSTASDGTSRPRDIVGAAVEARLDVIALTDHDTVSGIPEAIEAAKAHPIEVIAGLEVSTAWQDVELHILGYFVDPWNEELLAHTAVAARHRRGRLKGMVDRLQEQGVEVPFEMVTEAAADGAALGRPHLARAMVRAGIVESVPQAFDLYIGNAHPAYIPSRLLDPKEAIRMIERAGGVSVWAHPPMQRLDALLGPLKEAGLRGLEVFRPRTPQDRMLRLERAARNAGLFPSGGSDWHGPDEGPLGAFRVDARDIAGLLAAGGM
jgi:3',5'-nucleoside bisphosphate phosphatase